MRYIKIFASIIFILAVAFLTARFFFHKKTPVGAVATATAPTVRVTAKKPAAPPPVVSKAPKMAIILDDWGMNYSLVEEAVSIGRPLTLSVLPHLSHSKQIAEDAARRGLGVMLHLPMEPIGNGGPTGRRYLEPNTILISMKDDEIEKIIEDDTAALPSIQGVNNHMGSAATSDERVMRIVLNELKSRGLFFVDSNVITTSVVPKVAKEIGIPFTQRDVFIDNKPDVAQIKSQLLRAARIAERRGEVVVIGHDKRLTLDVIKETIPEIEKKGIRLVLVKELLNS